MSHFDAGAPTLAHKSVMLEQAMADLSPRANGKYLDGTLGLGGHAEELLRRAPGSMLCGLDRDSESLVIARERLAPFGDRAACFHLPFSRFEEALAELGWSEIDGALLDLGVSSPQLDNVERGFSFRGDARLDMRMDQGETCPTAWDIVNRAPFDELKNIFSLYGEEPRAGQIARNIVSERQKGAINGTKELADLVWRAYPPAWRKSARNHPATRVFQALRLKVNDELGELQSFLGHIMPRLSVGGRLAIISFHSLEDRMVKRAMKDWAAGCLCPPRLPVCECGHRPEARLLRKKPTVPDEAEARENPRARSAKLRACEKISHED